MVLGCLGCNPGAFLGSKSKPLVGKRDWLYFASSAHLEGNRASPGLVLGPNFGRMVKKKSLQVIFPHWGTRNGAVWGSLNTQMNTH